MLLPSKKNSLSTLCLNCFSKSSLDLKSCPSSSLQKKKKVHRSASAASLKATSRAHKLEFLSKSQLLGWQHLSTRDRVGPAPEVELESQPQVELPDDVATIEGYNRHTLYNSDPTLQKGE